MWKENEAMCADLMEDPQGEVKEQWQGWALLQALILIFQVREIASEVAGFLKGLALPCPRHLSHPHSQASHPPI